jgi:hypothetical protein
MNSLRPRCAPAIGVNEPEQVLGESGRDVERFVTIESTPFSTTAACLLAQGRIRRINEGRSIQSTSLVWETRHHRSATLLGEGSTANVVRSVSRYLAGTRTFRQDLPPLSVLQRGSFAPWSTKAYARPCFEFVNVRKKKYFAIGSAPTTRNVSELPLI